MKKLVFIEGVSGVGKSTLSVKLCARLNEGGQSSGRRPTAKAFLEGDADNPVELFRCACLTEAEFAGLSERYPASEAALQARSTQGDGYVLVRYGDSEGLYFPSPLSDYLQAREGFYKTKTPIPPERYAAVYRDLWEGCLRRVPEDVLIFDGCLLYHRANDLIANYRAADGDISALIGSLLSVMRAHEVFLFYLSSGDVGKRLAAARKERGKAETSDGAVREEIERKCRQTQILELLPIKPTVFDVGDGRWDGIAEKMSRIIFPLETTENHSDSPSGAAAEDS